MNVRHLVFGSALAMVLTVPLEASGAKKAAASEPAATTETPTVPPFKHTPFPTVPRGTIQKNDLIVALPTACEALTGAPDDLVTRLDEANASSDAAWQLAKDADDAATRASTLQKAAADARTAEADERSKNNGKVADQTRKKAAEAAKNADEAQKLASELAQHLAGPDSNVRIAHEGARIRQELKALLEPVDPAPNLKSLCAKLQGVSVTAQDVTFLKTLTKREKLEALHYLERWKASDFQTNTDVHAAATAEGRLQSDGALLGGSGAGLSDMLIQGLAEFLAKRAKEEALLYIQDQLKNKLCGDSGEGKEFFPATCRAIAAVSSEQSLESIGLQLKAAAIADLKELPDVSLAYLAHVEASLANPAFAGRLGYRFARELAAGRAPEDIMAQVGRIEFAPAGARSALTATRLASAIAYTLQQTDPGKEWAEKVSQIPAKWTKVAVGAAWALADVRMTDVNEELEKDEDLALIFTLDNLKHALRVGGGVFEGVVAARSDYKALAAALAAGEGTASADERRRQVAEAIQLATAALATQLRITGEILQKKELTKAAEVLRLAGEATSKAIYGDYGAAIVALGSAYGAVSPTKGEASDGHLQTVQHFFGFIVELASAENSEGVAAALDAYAAPLGTYKVKYRRTLVAIGALVGAYGGWEHIDADENGTSVWGGSGFVAAFAPVGITVTTPVCWKKSCNVDRAIHFGGMISVLDLGALTAYRFNSELDGTAGAEASQAPEVSFEQVFSPGAFLTLGLFNSPVVLGGGVSFSPELRTVSVDGTPELSASAVRVGAFLAIDVPIVPLH